MKYALVQGTRICEFAETVDACFPVASELEWIEVDDSATTNDTFIDGKVVTYVAPAMPVSTTVDGTTFLTRVTDAEYAAIIGSSSIAVKRWLDIFRLRGEIDVNGETAQAAKVGLVALGLLTQKRADEIFVA